ncbi:hypothetical protein BC629DRAFT_1589902 [Irpex lacteus]|nr:hypothetical protein BC629DRAFT_1589902 [Irpex lacteus]
MDASPYAVSARYLLDAKYYSLASCVMLFYDMILTFEDEVNRYGRSASLASQYCGLW